MKNKNSGMITNFITSLATITSVIFVDSIAARSAFIVIILIASVVFTFMQRPKAGEEYSGLNFTIGIFVSFACVVLLIIPMKDKENSPDENVPANITSSTENTVFQTSVETDIQTTLSVSETEVLTSSEIDMLTSEVTLSHSSNNTLQLKNPSEIGEGEFSKKSDLKGTVIIPNTVKIIKAAGFYDCDNIETVIIPEGVTEIENDVFSQCGNLKQVILPSTVTSIGRTLFYACGNLSEINLEDTKISTIFQSCFSHCYKLEQVKLPNTVEVIEEGAFYACGGLSEINLEDTKVSTIPQNCFSHCGKLKQIELPSTVKVIEDEAFYANSLTYIYICRKV
ncbi:MAG: leucine-rich repeat domain-containing protein [Ruminococcus sp.]|jgi:hypothetical protein|nr:leucine-rich repeat domain-containing protein [Ruminococcus sp.]